MTRAREKFCKKRGTGGWKMESRDDRRYSGKMEERSRKGGKKRREEGMAAGELKV